jgi:hypothetical protein
VDGGRKGKGGVGGWAYMREISASTSGTSMTHAEMDMRSSTKAYIMRVDVAFVHVVLEGGRCAGE